MPPVRTRLSRLRSKFTQGARESRASTIPPDWERRRRVAERYFIPWIDSVFPLAGGTVLEYGCGNGSVAAAFAPRAGRHIGVDIDEAAITEGRGFLDEVGVSAELRAAPLDRIFDDVRQLSEVDVFLCYAVLEHMSIDERLELLQLARSVVEPDGIIVVVETPNRLLPWDYHTAQLPFMNQLPEELALRYYSRSPRDEFVSSLDAAAERGAAELRESFTRWGRGMSYHEFELVFDDLARHTLACSWEPTLQPEREVYREELALQRVLDAARPDLPASFSRYWLDIVLSARPLPEARRAMRPWPLHTQGAVGVAYDAGETLQFQDGASKLPIDLPRASARLAVSVSAAAGTQVTIRDPGNGQQVTNAASVSESGSNWLEFELVQPAERYELTLGGPGAVSFVGYEA
jgi:2-polyprenyl-3-methyl-5-hydroxy-6-metoxy-1,4-benzoquinol methylase